MSLDDVAKVTKIQSRILERLETGKFDGLPAEVFVRGFVRSFARAVGLSEDEALRRYTACAKSDAPPSAKAFVESMSELAPSASAHLGNKTIADTIGFRATPIVVRVEASREIPLSQIVAEGEGISSAVEEIPVSFSDEPISAPIVSMARASEEIPAVTPIEIASFDSGSIATTDIEVAMLPETGTLSPIQAIAEALVPTKRKRTRAKTISTEPKEAKAKKPRKRRVATGTPHEASPIVDASEPANDGVVEFVETPSDLSGPIMTGAVTVSFDAPDPRTPQGFSDTATQFASFRAPDESVVEPIGFLEATSSDVSIDGSASTANAATATATASTTNESTTNATTNVASASTSTSTTASTTSADEEFAIGGVWSPKMPTAPTVTAPWRMSRGVTSTSATPVVPSLTIDDSDPDSAERELEDRQESKRPRARSFLPPILLDREDRAGRQGGLTLAVIILLIAATLTLSYLMRRPSSRGDGMTSREVPTSTHRTLA